MNLFKIIVCSIASILSLASFAHAASETRTTVTTKGACWVSTYGGWNDQWYKVGYGTMSVSSTTQGVTTPPRNITCQIYMYDMVAPEASINWQTWGGGTASCGQVSRTPWAGFSNIVIPATSHGAQSPLQNSVGDGGLKTCSVQYLCSNGSFVETPNVPNGCMCNGWSVLNTTTFACQCPAGTANVGGTCTQITITPPATNTGTTPTPPVIITPPPSGLPPVDPSACKARVTNTTPWIFWMSDTVETSTVSVGKSFPVKYNFIGFTTPINTIECFWPNGTSYGLGKAGSENGAPGCRQSSPSVFSWRLDSIDGCAPVNIPPINCSYVNVISWSCSATCGSGTQNTTYHIITPASNGGTCPVYQGQVASSQACNTQSCTTRICSSAGECSSKVPANREIDGNPNGYFVRYRGAGHLINVFQSNPVASATQLCQQYGMQYNSHTTLTHGIGCGYAYGLTYYRPEWFWKTDEAPICSLGSVTVIDSITCNWTPPPPPPPPAPVGVCVLVETGGTSEGGGDPYWNCPPGVAPPLYVDPCVIGGPNFGTSACAGGN